jgi:hypothetical protein
LRGSHAKISHFLDNGIRFLDKKQMSSSPSFTDTKNKLKILPFMVDIQHMLILEEVGPVALMGEGHRNGKLFGTACLLRQRGPCFDQRGRGRNI